MRRFQHVRRAEIEKLSNEMTEKSFKDHKMSVFAFYKSQPILILIEFALNPALC